MLTRRGQVVVPLAAAAAVAGIVYGVEEFVLLSLAVAAAVTGAAVAVAATSHRARRSLRIEVVRPTASAVVGSPTAVPVVLVNDGQRALAGLQFSGRARWQVSLPGLWGTASVGDVARAGSWSTKSEATPVPVPVPAPVPVLRPGARWEAMVALPADRRGLWSLDGRLLSVVDPLGLVTRPLPSVVALHLLVCPLPVLAGHAGPTWQPPGRDVMREASGSAPSGERGGDEFAGLRAYVAGDRLNRLHWPSLARTGELVVRDFTEPGHRAVELWIDDRPLLIEESVGAVAAAGLSALDGGAAVELVTWAGGRMTVTPGPHARAELLEALAVVAPARRARGRAEP